MTVEIFTVCERATVTPKTNVISIEKACDSAMAKTVPIAFRFAIIGRVRFNRSEYGEHNMRVEFLNPVGGSICNWETSVSISNKEDSTSVPIFIDPPNMVFIQYGTFKLVLTVDDVELSSVPFVLRPL